jgi:hypothetical protein
LGQRIQTQRGFLPSYRPPLSRTSPPLLAVRLPPCRQGSASFGGTLARRRQ